MSLESIKDRLSQAPALIKPNFSQEFILQTDASEVDLGVVLSQEINSIEHPILYISRKLLPREQRKIMPSCQMGYGIFEILSLGVIFCSHHRSHPFKVVEYYEGLKRQYYAVVPGVTMLCLPGKAQGR
ncbi:UNVERIFIED_CONTAM: hypothetical protein FKN15_035972 [Acipenser sinensis]